MTEIERIIDQSNRAFYKEAWHGSAVAEILAGISAETALAKPIASAHSAWEIVNHMAVWKRVACERLSGRVKNIDIGSDEDWPPVSDTSESAWTAAKENLESAHKELMEVVARLADTDVEKLHARGPTSDTNYLLAHGIVQHDLYHTGQIAILKKG